MIRPSADVVWSAIFLASAGVVGWAVSQIRLGWISQQKLLDHIVECDKRQEFIMDKLNHIESMLKTSKRWWT